MRRTKSQTEARQSTLICTFKLSVCMRWKETILIELLATEKAMREDARLTILSLRT